MSSSEIIKKLKAEGWKLLRTKGSHHFFIDATGRRFVTVPHPRKDVKLGTVKSIEKSTGVKLLP